MANCINTSSKEYIELLEQTKLNPLILKARISIFQDKNGLESFPKVEDIIQSNEVNQTLKAVDILSSNKAKQVFEKGQKNNWDLNKILTELQIPKEQKQLILDKNIEKNNIQDIAFIPQPKRGSNAYNINYKGELIGDFDLIKEGDIWVIDNVGLNKEFKGKGLGKESFRIANSKVPKGEGVLHSSGYFVGEDAKNVWNSLVKSGEAEKIGRDEWRFKEKFQNNLREEIITSLLANYSYTVEVNTAKDAAEVDWSGITSENVDSIFPETVSEDKPSLPDNNNHTNLFGDKNVNTLSANEVMKNLISSDAFETSKEVGFFLEKAMNLLNKSGATLKLINSKTDRVNYDKFTNNTVMMYDSKDNTIYVTEDSLNNYDAVTIASSFIHEVVHSTTVQAYFNPRTFEEKEFKKFIDKSFAQYRHLATKRDAQGKLSYGFTNQAEFIAEIYSNPEFVQEIKSIEKSWWSQFIDSIRRLFGMSKNVINSELINSAVLFNVVDEFATRDKSRWKGTLIYDPRYEKFGEFYKKVEKPQNSTLEDKINNLINSQLNNIETIIKRAHGANKKYGVKNDKFINQINLLNTEITRAVKTDKLKVINLYTDFMIDQINNIYNIVKNGSNAGQLEQLETIDRYKSYLGASDLLKPIMDTLNDTRVKNLSESDQKVIYEIQDKLRLISGTHDQITSMFKTHTVEEVRKKLKTSYFSEKIVQDFRTEIAKEYPKDSPISKKEWVNQEVLNRQDELNERIEEDINEVIDGLSTDIDGFDKNLLSSLNTKSRLIQIVAKVIAKMKSKIDSKVRDNDFKLDKLYQDLVKEKGKYDITNLYEVGEDGTTYIKGQYSVKFRDKYINEYSKYLDEVNELKEKYRKQGYSDFEINDIKEVRDIYRKLEAWRKENTIKVGGKLTVHPKYKNDLKFSKAEKAIYNEYVTMAKKSKELFGTHNSLIKNSLDAEYITLPYATVSNLERITSGRLNVKDTVKQKITSITDWKIDDLENTSEEMYRQDGTRIFNIPIMYRNNVSKIKEPKKYQELIKEQSFDLLTLMRLEHYNQTNFKIKSENEMFLNSLVEVSKEKDYLKTKPGSNNLVSNLFGVKTKHVTFKGVESNEYSRLKTIVEQSLYNKFYEESFKVLGKDVNKLVQSANKHTSFLGMSLNYFNAPVNVINAEFQTFMIKLGGDINSGNIRSAHQVYAKDLPNIIADTGRPTKYSLVNQLNLLTDVFGGLTHEQNDFVKNTILKGIADPQMLQIMQNGGEHMVQSVLNIALLKSIKVLNDKGQYINSKGDVVSEKDAASLFDMVEQNEQTKQINFNKKFTYTDKSTVTKWDEGGLENVRLFIKKKLFDTMGEYDKNFQTQIQTQWWGQLLMMYKKFIIPLGIARYRGAGKMLAKKENLTEEDRHWNESLQEYEEGFYTTTFRFITRGLIQNLVQLKFDLISQDYNNLSDYEKANLKKGIVELGLLMLLQTVIVPLMVGLAAGDDDDELLYLAMLARRLEQELSFYTDPNDAYKVTKQPIAATNLVESLIDVGKFTLSPGLWFSENREGDLRAYKVIEKVTIPSAMRPDRTSKSVLQGMNRGLLAPYEEGIFYQLMNE